MILKLFCYSIPYLFYDRSHSTIDALFLRWTLLSKLLISAFILSGWNLELRLLPTLVSFPALLYAFDCMFKHSIRRKLRAWTTTNIGTLFANGDADSDNGEEDREMRVEDEVAQDERQDQGNQDGMINMADDGDGCAKIDDEEDVGEMEEDGFVLL